MLRISNNYLKYQKYLHHYLRAGGESQLSKDEVVYNQTDQPDQTYNQEAICYGLYHVFPLTSKRGITVLDFLRRFYLRSQSSTENMVKDLEAPEIITSLQEINKEAGGWITSCLLSPCLKSPYKLWKSSQLNNQSDDFVHLFYINPTPINPTNGSEIEQTLIHVQTVFSYNQVYINWISKGSESQVTQPGLGTYLLRIVFHIARALPGTVIQGELDDMSDLAGTKASIYRKLGFRPVYSKDDPEMKGELTDLASSGGWRNFRQKYLGDSNVFEDNPNCPANNTMGED